MISKELLREVLKIEYVDEIYIEDNLLYFCELNKGINIYELAFRTRDYFKIRSKHLSLNQNIDDIFKEANSIYESLSQ